MRTIYLLIPLLFSVSTAFAETGPLGLGERDFFQDMQSDRPDFTEGTQTVQSGHIQVEMGYTFTYDDEDGVEARSHSTPEILLRAGFLADTELRFAWEGYVAEEFDTDSGTSDADGFSDMSVGIKHRMMEDELFLPDVSILLELGLPIGDDERSADEVEPAAVFLLSYELSDEMELSGNLGFAAPMSDDERYFEVSSSASLGYGLTDTLGAYFEYFGIYPADSIETETSTHFLNGGFTYAFSRDLQFDIRSGFGLNEAADDFFAGTGLVFRY